MFDYIAEGQMSIMDLLVPDTSERNPELSVGTRIYKLVLDKVETGVIDHLWELEDTYGYSALEEGRGGYITFWSPNINDTVFIDKKRAYSEAESLKNTYEVIRANEFEVVKEQNFVEICDDSRRCISATVKLLKENMLYYSPWFCYHFLEIYDNEKMAKKRYQEELIKIQEGIMSDWRLEVNIPVELKDMYLCVNGNWSEYGYVNHNRPVMLPNNQGRI